MNRLSAYAARESESEPVEERIQNEQEAVRNLLDRLRISEKEKEKQNESGNSDSTGGDNEGESQTNGTVKEDTPVVNGDKKADDADSGTPSENDSPASHKKRGIPENVKLYEIFYEQVTSLVDAQRLPIQDTTALLVSLANLAM